MKKKALFAAMSAGLLAGTGAGFVLGVPGLTSAAGDVETGSMDERSSDDADGRHGRGKGKGGKMGSPETLATALGVDTETLRSEFAAGKSIADIAAEQGIAIDTVVAALVADLEEHLNEHVADGSLTEDEAAEKLEAMEAKITERLNTVPEAGERLRGPKHDGDGAFHRGYHDHADDDAVAEA